MSFWHDLRYLLGSQVHTIWTPYMINAFQHYLNPLHVYCRLRDVGVPKSAAILACKFYERAVFNHFQGFRKMGRSGMRPLVL